VRSCLKAGQVSAGKRPRDPEQCANARGMVTVVCSAANQRKRRACPLLAQRKFQFLRNVSSRSSRRVISRQRPAILL
jgi:hypothetical protein